MKYLLDTHTFIWWDSNAANLSKTARSICQDVTNTLVLSVVSVWEIQIKAQLGKLTLTRPLQELVEQQRTTNGIEILSVRLDHVFLLDSLPMHHQDPFDRLLVAQARLEGLPFLSRDRRLEQYPVQVIW